MFEGDKEIANFEAVAALVPNLLICVATYSLAESFNLAFAFALRGAGDTKYVSRLTFVLGWPIMVIPTLLVVWLMPGMPALYWSWVFATVYIFVMAVCFWLRFRGGKWKSMRVIESVPVDELTDVTPADGDAVSDERPAATTAA
jgi:MATE family multidrug resistance protein